jgi:hypothetical protein
VFGNKRQQSQVAGQFNGRGQHPLVFGAIPGHPAGYNLSAFGHEVAKTLIVFVIDLIDLLQAELAVFSVEYPAFFGIAGVVFVLFFQHDTIVFLKYVIG